MRKAVSTAEKREELEAKGEEWPLYPDGTRQLWSAKKSCRDGGHWLSFESAKARREHGRAQNVTDRRRAQNVKYDASDKGKARRARYAASDRRRACMAKYDASDKGKAKQARYRASDRGRAVNARLNGRRIMLGRVYLGRENHFPAPKEAVLAFARELRKEHLPWHA